MEFVVYRRRIRGRERQGTPIGGAEVCGYLSVIEERSPVWARTTRVARLVDAQRRPLPDPPPLLDFPLVLAKSDLWTNSGIEFADHNGIMQAHAQTWLMIPATEYDRREQEVRQMAALPVDEHSNRIGADTYRRGYMKRR